MKRTHHSIALTEKTKEAHEEPEPAERKNKKRIKEKSRKTEKRHIKGRVR